MINDIQFNISFTKLDILFFFPGLRQRLFNRKFGTTRFLTIITL